MKGLARYLKYYFWIAKLSFMSASTYRASHILRYIRMVLEISISLFVLNSMFLRSDKIGDWSREETFLLYAIWSMVVSLYHFIVSGSAYQTSREIRNGSIDILLTKPFDSQFLATFRQMHLDNIFRIIGSVIITFYSLSLLNIRVPLALSSLFVFQIVASVLIYHSLIFLAVIATFVTQGGEQLHLVETITFQSKYPLDIFSRRFTLVLSSVIPLLYISTVPAKTLLGKLDVFSWIIFPLALAFSLLTRKLWQMSLRQYTSAA
jgi:ABC-2 type transport system permease protein